MALLTLILLVAAKSAEAQSDRICCEAMTAQCLACKRGWPVDKFCSLPQYRAVPGCQTPRFLPGGAPPRSACLDHGNLSIGQEVTARSRGHAMVACMSQRDRDVVGICSAPNTGHDNYRYCVLGQQAKPAFCGSRALWFVRCQDLLVESRYEARMSESTAEPAPVPDEDAPSAGAATAVSAVSPAAPSRLCGCSWSSQHGCVVSSKQLIASLTSTELVKHACSAGTPECDMRKQIVEHASGFTRCIGLGPWECRANPQCQWGAQGSGECGFDEEQLVLRLAGPEHRNHPLVKMIMLHDHCSKHSEEACDADAGCSWLPSHPQASCDVKPALMIRMMVMFPDMVMALQRISAEAMCRAYYEANHSRRHTCPQPRCQLKDGVCALAQWNEGPEALERMLNALCLSSFRYSDVCPGPCRLQEYSEVGDEVVRKSCVAPRGFDFQKAVRATGSWSTRADNEQIIRVMTVLMSSSWLYQNQCERGPRAQCQSAAPICEEHEERAMGLHEIEHGPDGASPAGPALKGVLKRASRAIAAGQAGQFLEDYLENHPEALKNITSKALESLSSLFHSEPTTIATSTLAATTTVPPSTTVNITAVVTSSLQDASAWLLNPWILAATAVMAAAVCSGVAFGALCHARLGAQAREPLLGGFGGGGEPMAARGDQEMAPMPAATSGA